MYMDDIAVETLRDDFKLSEDAIRSVDGAYKRMEGEILAAIRDLGDEIGDIVSKYKRIFNDLDNKNRGNKHWKLSDFFTETYDTAGYFFEQCARGGVESRSAQEVLADLRDYINV